MTDKIKRYLRLYFTGFSMGSADIVPGVSGGTIAFLLGIYEELIWSIRTVTGDVLRLFFVEFKFREAFQKIPFAFLLPLGFGIITAILALSQVMHTLLNTQPVLVWSFFFGLILASIWVLRKRITEWTKRDYLALASTTILAYWLTGLVPVETSDHPLMIALSGAIAICAMILPGISGSFLLVILGKYEQILTALTERDFLTLGIFCVGILIGISLFVRVLIWLLAHHHNITIAALIGFMIGSLRKVWPYKETLTTRINSSGEIVPLLQKNVLPGAIDQELIIALILAVLGFTIVWILEKMNLTKEQNHDLEDPAFEKSHPDSPNNQESPLVK